MVVIQPLYMHNTTLAAIKGATLLDRLPTLLVAIIVHDQTALQLAVV